MLWKKVLFLSKNADFVQKMLTPAKFRELLIYKSYFVKLNMCLHLRIESQVSSVILTRFRQGVVLPPFPSSKQTPKNAFEIRVNINCNIDGSSHPYLFLEKYVFKEKAKFLQNLQRRFSLFSKSASCHSSLKTEKLDHGKLEACLVLLI